MLEPYEKSLIRGSYRLARRGSRKSKEAAKEQALRMFVGWAGRTQGKRSPKSGSGRLQRT